MSFINRITIVSFFISIILAGCRQSPAVVIAPTLKSPVGTQEIYKATTSLTAKSVIVPLEPEADLAFVTSGYVESVNVHIGDIVHAGDTLVELDTVVLKAELARVESAVKAAKANMNIEKN
jgi:multidrug efflux pump subunit AcrA (membrane-fusion protein)